MVKNVGIYIITSPSGKVYIGSSKRLDRREKEHFYELSKGVHHCHALQKAYDKYGNEMRFVIIQYCEIEELETHEQFWIDNAFKIWNEIYNSSKLAGRIEINELTRKRMSDAKLGKKLELNEEDYKKRLKQLDVARAKRKHESPSTETKNRMKQSAEMAWKKPRAKRKPMSNEAKANMSEARRVYWAAKKRERLEQLGYLVD